jgi:uncharacterized protein (DUF433 family)
MRDMSDDLLSRITIEDGKRGGKPCIRGLRMTVAEVLGMLAAGESAESILRYHPDLEAEDILACLAYGAREVDHPVIIAA